MTEVILPNSNLTMSHIEIAEVVGSRPDNVKVTIERLVSRGVISKPAMQEGKKSANGVVTSKGQRATLTTLLTGKVQMYFANKLKAAIDGGLV